MLKIENVEVVGWEHAIRGMRNPMNSWEKSDSRWEPQFDATQGPVAGEFVVGPNDHDLMMRLRNAGTDHRKFMRMITVYLDITAPLYWWKEFDTYKVGTVANSCSTMHKIHAKEFTLEDFSYEHLISEPYDVDNDELIDGEFEDTGLVLVANNDNGWLGQCYHTASGNKCVEYLAPKNLLDRHIIGALNANRKAYIEADKKLKRSDLTDEERKHVTAQKKRFWWQMIQLLPTSYNQKRTVMLNYEVLANIYKARRNHKLDEWHTFCEWIESLPYSELITGGNESNVENV